jgi:hypothetical protein
VRDRTSTATTRAPVDHPTIDHRERLRDRRIEIATRPSAKFPPKKIGSEPAYRRPPSRRATCDRPRASSRPCLSLLAQSYPCASVSGWEATYPAWRHRARSIDAGRAPTTPTLDHPATSLGPRCAIATARSENFFKTGNQTRRGLGRPLEGFLNGRNEGADFLATAEGFLFCAWQPS